MLVCKYASIKLSSLQVCKHTSRQVCTYIYIHTSMQVCNAGLQESKYKICNYAIIQTFYIHINLGGGFIGALDNVQRFAVLSYGFPKEREDEERHIKIL